VSSKQQSQAESQRQKAAIEELLNIMAMLRDGELGCPWDLEQSIRSLVPFTIEEVYEVVDAIERDDMVDLEDELGDLLFQVVFYAQLAKEQGLFTFADIANGISAKLVRRHPHVFPGGKVEEFGKRQEISSDQVVVNWEQIKEQERAEKKAKRGTEQVAVASSVLDDVPRALPALERARKLQKRAARVGFDWPDVGPVIDKLKEEIAELEQAIANSSGHETATAEIQRELGDVLFSAVNLARHLGEEPEVALRTANIRFEERFRWIEMALQRQGKKLQNASLAELDSLWDEAKASGL